MCRLEKLEVLASDVRASAIVRDGIREGVRLIEQFQSDLVIVEKEIGRLNKLMPEMCPLCEGTGRLRK
jgi:hypothetical protein